MDRVLSGGGSRFGFFLDKAGHGFTRLRSLAQPILGAIQVERKIVTLLQRMVSAEFLDTFAVARAAAVSHHDAKNGLVFRADALHANSYCHSRQVLLCLPRYCHGISRKRGESLDVSPRVGKGLFALFLRELDAKVVVVGAIGL